MERQHDKAQNRYLEMLTDIFLKTKTVFHKPLHI